MTAHKTPEGIGGLIPEQLTSNIESIPPTSQPFNIGDRVSSAYAPDLEVLGIGPWHGAPSGWLVCTNGRSVRCVCASTLPAVSNG